MLSFSKLKRFFSSSRNPFFISNISAFGCFFSAFAKYMKYCYAWMRVKSRLSGFGEALTVCGIIEYFIFANELHYSAK